MLSGFDLLIVLFLAFHTWRGLQKGLVRALIGVIGWLLALYAGSHFAASFAPLFSGIVLEPWLQTVLAFLSLMLLMWAVLWLIGAVVCRVLDALALRPLERLAGGAFGLVKGVLITLILLTVLSPFASRTEFWQRSQGVQILLPYAPLAMQLSRQLAAQAWQSLQTPLGSAPAS